MAFQIARGLPLGRFELELRAAGVALAGLALGVGIDPWFYLVSVTSAGFLVIHALQGSRPLQGGRAAESVLDLEQSRIASRRSSGVTRDSWSGATIHQSKGVGPAGPWRVVTDPVSEHKRLPPCGDVWTIIDVREQVVFTGTKRDCEDWLDYQDNVGSWNS